MKNNFLYFIIVILLFFIFIQYSCNKMKLIEFKSKIDLLNIQNQKLDSIKNKQGNTIYTQEVAIIESKKELKKYTDIIFNLKRKHERKVKDVITYYKKISRTGVDTFFVFEIDSIPYPEYITIEFINDSMITVPRTYKVNDPYFQFDATVKKEGMLINNISFPDTLHGRFIEKKNGFLKPKTIEYQFFNTNPYVKTQSSNSIIYKKKGKFWNKLKQGALYIGIGILIGTQL